MSNTYRHNEQAKRKQGINRENKNINNTRRKCIMCGETVRKKETVGGICPACMERVRQLGQ